MQWASLWPSSVIKTGVSLAAQSALFCHPPRNLHSPGNLWLPTFSVRPVRVRVSSSVTASFTRSFTLVHFPSSSSSSFSSSTFSFALSATDGLRAPLALPAPPHALSSGLNSPLYFWLTSSLHYAPLSTAFLRFRHPPAALMDEQRCEGLFKPVPRFSHLALDFGHSALGRFSREIALCILDGVVCN